jgi:hypothetical protein
MQPTRSDRPLIARGLRKPQIHTHFQWKSLPAVPSIPGHRRWKAILKQAAILVERAAAEMETYFDQRSEQWQDSQQAEAFTEIMDSTRSALEALQEVPY